MKIIKVFPSKTKATPTDNDVRINKFPTLFDEADQIHISVTFTWDIAIAYNLYNQWKYVAPTFIGGPAITTPSDQFIPGQYLKPGYVITSRGCNNNCWFCSVWKREGTIREFKINNGFNVLDDNLLQCSYDHILSVFDMLKKQTQKPIFSGGLESKLLTKNIAFKLYDLKPKKVYFAFDHPDNLNSLISAGQLLFNAGFSKSSHVLSCYVLIGYPKDTFKKALKRISQTWNAGFFPFAMLYRNKKGTYDHKWKQFQRKWANPIITGANLKKL